MRKVLSACVTLAALTFIAVGSSRSAAKSEIDANECVTMQSEVISSNEKGKKRSLALARCSGDEFLLFVANGADLSGSPVTSSASKEFEQYRLQARPPVSINLSVGNCVRAGKPISGPIAILGQWNGRNKISINQGLVSIFQINNMKKEIKNIDLAGISCYSDEP